LILALHRPIDGLKRPIGSSATRQLPEAFSVEAKKAALPRFA